MPTLTLTVDARTEAGLFRISGDEKIPTNAMALGLPRRALREKRPKPVWNEPPLCENAVLFAAEDVALAESDVPHRAALLQAEGNTR
jgi:hypothetical protein